jgi:hypothetical protein
MISVATQIRIAQLSGHDFLRAEHYAKPVSGQRSLWTDDDEQKHPRDDAGRWAHTMSRKEYHDQEKQESVAGQQQGLFDRGGRFTSGRGGTVASQVEHLRQGDRTQIDGTALEIQFVRTAHRSEPLFHPTDPKATEQGIRRVKTTTVRGINAWHQPQTHTFYEVVSEVRPWEQQKPQSVAGQQQGLFDRGEFTTGQKSLFNVISPDKPKSKARKTADLFAGMAADVAAHLKGKATISPADAGIVVQPKSLAGQRAMFSAVRTSVEQYQSDGMYDNGPGHWVTIRGTHIKIHEGQVVAGPKKFKGKRIDAVVNTHGPITADHGKTHPDVAASKGRKWYEPDRSKRKKPNSRYYNKSGETLDENQTLIKNAINDAFKTWIGKAQLKPGEREALAETSAARAQEAKAEQVRRNWVDPPLVISPGLSPEEAAIEQRTQQTARQHWPEIRAKYLAKNSVGAADGTIQSLSLNTDEWREMFHEYVGTNASAVHEASSYCNKRMLGEAFAMMKGVGNGKMAVLAGGGGSGKGTATDRFLQAADYPIVVDQVTDNLAKAQKLFGDAKSNGYASEVTFVDRDPSKAWLGDKDENGNLQGGVVGRAISGRAKGGMARTVPLSVALHANLQARKTALQMLKDHPEILVSVIDNNKGFGEAEEITDRQQAIDYLSGQSHDFDSLLGKLTNDTQRLHESGHLPADIAAGLLPHAAVANGRLQSGSTPGGDQPGVSAGRAQTPSAGRAGSQGQGSSTADAGAGRGGEGQWTKLGPGTMKVADLQVDPKRFQYKLNTDNAAGVTDGLKESKKFNPELAGVIYVWHDPADGKDYVVNGHHRYDLAKRDEFQGQLQTYHIKAKDATEARAIGALKNIASGRGTAVDAAKFLRDSGRTPESLEKDGISLKGKTLKDGLILRNLGQGMFDRVVDGSLSQNRAMAIADSLPNDHDTQARVLRAVEAKEEKAGRELSDSTVSEMAKEASLAGKRTTTEKTLWGEDTFDESLMADRAEIKAHIKNDLRSRINKFAAVATTRAANTLAAKNVINADQNASEAKRLSQLLDEFTRESSYTGQTSDWINGIAKQYADANRSGQKKLLDEAKAKLGDVLAAHGAKSDIPADDDEPKPVKPLPGQKGMFAREPYARMADDVAWMLRNYAQILS